MCNKQKTQLFFNQLTLSVWVVCRWGYNCRNVTHLLVTILLVSMVINVLVAMVTGYWGLLVRIIHWRPAYVHLTHSDNVLNQVN